MSILAFLSTQVIDTTTVGRSVMTAATAAAARTAIGAGVGDVLTTGSYANPSWISSLAWSKISTTPTTLSGYGITDAITAAAVAAGYQPLDADLTALAALTGTNNIYYRSAADTWSSVTIGTGLTFAGGTLAASGGAAITSLNGLTGATQTFAVGTAGTDFAISSTGTAHTFNIPDASATNRGLVTTGTQTIAGAKTLTAQLNWASGLGSSVTHVLGPTDQTLKVISAAPSQTTTANPGQSLELRAANAVAGTTSVTAASGGNVTIIAGNAATNGGGSPFPTAAGGSITIGAGDGAASQSAGSTGGSVLVYAGNAGSGIAGTINIVGAGTKGAANSSWGFNGGPINIFTPVNFGGTGNFVGGTIAIYTGSGAASTGTTASAGAPIQITTAAGNACSGTGGTAGVGGTTQIVSGPGGAATGTSGTVTGGIGGPVTITAGKGGAATSASGTRIGGLGGAVILTAGDGGNGTTTNGAGGSITLVAGVSGTGSGTSASAGKINLNSQVTSATNVVQYANGTTAQTLQVFNTYTSDTSFERLNIAWAANVCTIGTEAGSGGGTLRGLRIGSANTSLLAFWGATPIVQPTTAIAAATRVGGGGTALTDTDTFDGYTLAQIVKALRNIGALA